MFCCGCLFKFNSTYKGEGCQSPQLDGSYWLRFLRDPLKFSLPLFRVYFAVLAFEVKKKYTGI